MNPLIFLSALFLPLDSIGSKMNKTTGNARLLSAAFLTAAAGAISWTVSFLLGNRVSADMLFYAIPFACLYAVGTLLAYTAFSIGPLSGTTLFGNSSLVLVILFSCVYFKERLTLVGGIGVVGALLSLILLNLPEKSDGGKKGINLPWILVCVGMLLCNSLLSIISKLRQTGAAGKDPFAFMALCYSFTFIAAIISYSLTQIKQSSIKKDLSEVRQSLFPLAIQSTGNAGANLLVTYLASRVNASVLYPFQIGGGLILTVICGFIFFRDRATIKNILGIIIGVMAMVLLNL